MQILKERKKKDEMNYFRDQTTVFCNKYEEDVNVPTVVNRFANIIVDIETFFNVDIDDEIENDEIDDTEEQKDIQENIFDKNQYESTHVQDEILDEDTLFEEFDETHADKMTRDSARNLKNTLEKVKKIPVWAKLPA